MPVLSKLALASFTVQSGLYHAHKLNLRGIHHRGSYNGYEYGDLEAHARDADSFDYSPSHFIAADEGRDAIKMTGNIGVAGEARRQKALQAQDHFDSEDTPSTDDFVQVAVRHPRMGNYGGYEYGDREAHARDADSSNYSPSQFLDNDSGRDAPSMTANLGAAAQARRQRALQASDHFDSEDTPSNDDFVQLSARTRLLHTPGAIHGMEYGDREMHARDVDNSDFSMAQFLKSDDARDAISMTKNIGAAAEARRQQILDQDSHFDSQDTPSTEDDFMQLASKHRPREARPSTDDDFVQVAARRPRRGSYNGYEYGDREMHARDADSFDYSPSAFIRADDGRDGMSMTANIGAVAEARRQKALQSQDHFDSEDTPSTDDFMQLQTRHRPGSVGGYEYGDREAHARDVDTSDFSAAQFLNADDARDPIKLTANIGAAAEARRQKVLASEDHFDSQSTPSTDDDF